MLFYGNEVLKLDKPLDTAWFEAYKNLFSAHYNFVVSRNDSIIKWTGTGDAAGAQKAFKSGVVATVAINPVTVTLTTALEEAKKAPVTVKKAPVQKAAVKENKKTGRQLHFGFSMFKVRRIRKNNEEPHVDFYPIPVIVAAALGAGAVERIADHVELSVILENCLKQNESLDQNLVTLMPLFKKKDFYDGSKS
jgi:hypothetical protein